MKSGLEDRNNEHIDPAVVLAAQKVSMKSGLEDRNNRPASIRTPSA